VYVLLGIDSERDKSFSQPALQYIDKKKVSDIPAGDGKTANLFLLCSALAGGFKKLSDFHVNKL
jgi:hypothetical protein